MGRTPTPPRNPLADPKAFWISETVKPWAWIESPESVLVGWGRPRWVFSGKQGEGEIVHDDGRRRKTKAPPFQVLRELLAAQGQGGAAVGFWGYECAARWPDFGFLKSPAGPVPDYAWGLPRFWKRWPKKRAAGGVSAGLVFPAMPRRNGKRFRRAAARAKRYIAAGDIYQANLSHQMDFPWPSADAADRFFFALRDLNPSPYACYLHFGSFALAGASPELLLKVRDARVETRPIAGTRPRGKTKRADEKLSGELLLSAKERAEHVMLLDLERNDLGRVCAPGSVRVAEKMVLEKYSHVAHIVSHVEGRLAAGLDGFDAFQAVFPGGTITGCPKIRSMQVIRELEGKPRGPFYGSAGWADAEGNMEMNILIRTALFHRGRMSVRVGAGIVADSDPRREFEETLQKGAALLKAYADSRPT